MEWNWERFLGRPQTEPDKSLALAAVSGQRVLITGAGGSIGGRMAGAMLAGEPETLILLDSSEQALYDLCRRIPVRSANAITRVIPVVGSVCDPRLLEHLFRQHRINHVLHAAAHKHVPLMEENPFSAMANNAVGTFRLVTMALHHDVDSLLLVSTDKAVSPSSIMGASKRVAELAVLSHARCEVRMNAVRLGNVLGSSGSVVPLFEEQLERGLPVTVTDSRASRYLLTPAEVEIALLRAASSDLYGKIFLPDCALPHLILDLARYMTDEYRKERGDAPSGPPEIELIGLRAGEKLHEAQISPVERIEDVLADGVRILSGPVPSAAYVAATMEQVESAIEQFDLQAMLAATMELVPDFAPDGRLQRDTHQLEFR